MGLLHVRIPDDLDVEFRKRVLDTKGTRKGALTEAVIEAIQLWLREYGSQK